MLFCVISLIFAEVQIAFAANSEWIRLTPKAVVPESFRFSGRQVPCQKWMRNAALENPRCIDGLQLWLDANDAATVFEATDNPAEVGDTVAEWWDKSGNNNHVTEATNKPLWSQTGALTGYANKIVNFDGSNDRLRNLAAVGLDAHATFTFFIVHNRTLSSSNRDPIETASGTTNIWRERLRSTTVDVALSATIGGVAEIGSRSWGNLNTFYVRKTTYDGANMRYYYLGTNDTDAAAGSLVDGQTVTLTLGDTAGAAAFAGSIAEVIFYDHMLSATEISAIEAYLLRKWGV